MKNDCVVDQSVVMKCDFNIGKSKYRGINLYKFNSAIVKRVNGVVVT